MIKVFIIAGEDSGDFIGSKLIDNLKKEFDNKIEIFGIGGNKMIASGLKPIFHSSELSIMGIFEVIKNIFKLKELINLTLNKIKGIKPDIVIGIDAQDFNKIIFSKIKNYNIKKIQIVAPSVWAWRPKRAKQLSSIIDYLFTLFEFENKYFTKYGLKTYCCGHPIFENKKLEESTAEFLYETYGIDKNKKIITLLPGSRLSEISKTLPIILEVAKNLKLAHELSIFMPITKNTENFIKNNYNIPSYITLISNEDIKYSLFKASTLAIAASGTVTLELAITKTPTIVIYKTNFLTSLIARKLVKLKYVSIINIFMNEEIFPELLLGKCTHENILNTANNILLDNNYKQNIITKTEEFVSKIKTPQPTQKIAKLIKKYIKKNND